MAPVTPEKRLAELKAAKAIVDGSTTVLLTRPDVAKMLSVSLRTVRRYEEDGRLVSVLLAGPGSARRILASSVAALVAGREVAR